MGTRHLGAAVASLALLIAAACSAAEPEAVVPNESRATSSPPPTPARASAAPTSPEALVRAWLSTSDEMQATGDTTRFRALSTSDCSGCEELAELVEEMYAVGGHAEDPETKVLSIEGKVVNDRFRYVTKAKLKPTTVHLTPEKKQSFPGGRETYVFGLLGSDGTWRVRSFARMPK